MKRPTILLIAIFISLVSMAEKRFQIGDFCYQIISETDKTVAVFSCATTATDITIPEKVSDNGSEYSVTTIGIPDFITAIEESGFDKCENLQSVSIPPSVSKIEELGMQDSKVCPYSPFCHFYQRGCILGLHGNTGHYC